MKIDIHVNCYLSRYTFGLSVGIVGLLMLLEKSINGRHGKHLLGRA